MLVLTRTRRPANPPDVVESLVNDHFGLVETLAWRFARRSRADVGDLLSAGYEALFHAARGYDANNGTPFGPYAAVAIRRAFVRETALLSRLVSSEREQRGRTKLGRPEVARLARLPEPPTWSPEALLIEFEEAEIARQRVACGVMRDAA